MFAWKGEVRAVEELCRLNADFDAEDCMPHSVAGNTPLHIAALSGHLDVIRVLINYGAATGCRNTVNCTQEGQKALDLAPKELHQSVEQLLRHSEDEHNKSTEHLLSARPTATVRPS